MELEANQRLCHIVVVPYPGRGHINPMFKLCNQLLSSASKFQQQNFQLSFTIILTEEWATLIDSDDLPGQASVATIPNVIPSENARGADNEGFLEAVYTRMEGPVEEVLDGLGGPVPSVIIADTFLPWVVGLGNRRSIPVAFLWPLLACLFPPLHHYELLVRNGHYPLDPLIGERGDERVDYIPGIGSTRLADLPLVLHSYKKRMLDLMLQAMSFMPKAQFIILRTLNELEQPAIDVMKTTLPNIPIYPIGPAISLPNDSSPLIISDSEPDYIQWLDRQSEGSVLFVSLGSHLLPSRTQMEELVVGLTDSCVPFLFVGREETPFLKGLCGENGFIVNWCDQMKVLYHKSIGGFLNHAGLNSVLESAFAGVPMLTFPLSTDQPMYSKLVVEDWEIGWRMRDKIEKDVLVKREKVTKIVNKFMDFGDNERKGMKKCCKELKVTLWKAVAQDSIAEHNVTKFLQEILTNPSNE